MASVHRAFGLTAILTAQRRSKVRGRATRLVLEYQPGTSKIKTATKSPLHGSHAAGVRFLVGRSGRDESRWCRAYDLKVGVADDQLPVCRHATILKVRKIARTKARRVGKGGVRT